MKFISLDLIKSLSINDGWIRSCNHNNMPWRIGDIVYRFTSVPMVITGINGDIITCEFINGNQYKKVVVLKNSIKKFKKYKKLKYENGVPII